MRSTGRVNIRGNWAGKLFPMLRGKCVYGETEYTIVDLPGTYSLMAHSAEEEVARDYICFGESGRGGGGLRCYLSGTKLKSGAANHGDHQQCGSLCESDG